MRVSPSDIRSGIADTDYRVPASRTPIPTPHSVITRAVRLLHTAGHGETAAVEYLDERLSTDFWRKDGNATKARNARASFDNYRRRALADARVAVPGDHNATVAVGPHVVAAGCDVVLVGDRGYDGRLCLWGIQERPLSEAELALLACPIVLALDNELGEDRIGGLEIWFLRSDVATYIPAEHARARIADFETLVGRITAPR